MTMTTTGSLPTGRIQLMLQNTFAVIGSTGLVGSHIVGLLKEENASQKIRLLVRRPVEFSHPKLEIKLVNFEGYESLKLAIAGCNVVFCAVGTTQSKVKGDQLLYRKIDYDIPVNAARACLETGGSSFLLVSSVGADSNSKNFYLRLKGEVEEAVQKFPIKSISMFRPSMLLGNRKDFRLGERIGQSGMKLIAPLLASKWRKYKAIEARDVAAAMIEASKQNKEGFIVYEYDEMKRSII
jgi:uncharacterized protein YbjT (DUF2867 family)